MTSIRALIRDHRTLAMLLVAVALFVKVLVPSGYMAGTGQKLLSVQICLDGINHKTVQLAVPADGSSHQDSQGHPPCAFTALSMGALAGSMRRCWRSPLPSSSLWALRPPTRSCVAGLPISVRRCADRRRLPDNLN